MCGNWRVSGQTNPVTVAVPGDEPRPEQFQPSLTNFSLIHVKDLGRSRPWSQKEPGVGAVVTSCGRLFHSGIVLGKKVTSACKQSGEMECHRRGLGYTEDRMVLQGPIGW